MINPNKHIRKAIVDSLLPNTRVFYKRVPKDIETPREYVIMNSQSKRMAFNAKGCYEWICTINLDCWVHTVQGMPPSVVIDDLEEIVLNAMSGLEVGGGFTTKYVNLIDQNDLSIETDSESIERRVLIYELWINKI